MTLTDTQIRNIKAEDKPRKYFDGGGLYLHVYPTGGKLWQLAYRFNGKPKTLSIGQYPVVSLKEAREQRENAKKLLTNGVDPAEYKKAVKASVYADSQNTFEVIAREWHSKQLDKWTEGYANQVINRLINDVFPAIGGKPIKTVTGKDILEALQKIEERGAIESAHRMKQVISQVFRYAQPTGRVDSDPAVNLSSQLKPIIRTSFASITDSKEIGYLLRDIDNYQGNVVVRMALRLLPYVFLRSRELRGGEWQEINFADAEWRVPADRMKMKELHIVPLSNQAVELLKEIKPYTGHSKYIFPSPMSNTRPISDMALLNALRRMGYEKGVMTVHGFRSMASTLLNEKGYNRDWIERQLAHGERNKIRAAYNYAEYLPQRRKMMQEYADYLDVLKASAKTKVIALRVNEG